MAPEISIVIVSFNTREVLHECLQAVAEHCDLQRCEVIVVDNDSRDGSPQMVRESFAWVKLLALDNNLGFGLGNNAGVEAAVAPYVMLLNSDAILSQDTPARLCEYLKEHTDVVCVGPKIVMPSGKRQPKVYGHLPTLAHLFNQSLGLNGLFPAIPFFRGIDDDTCSEREMNVGWISGVCMMMPRTAYLSVGGFDKAFFMYCEDIDLCARLQDEQGGIVHLEDFALMHYGGESSKSCSAKVRNTLWQQRNLLFIVKRRSGWLSYQLAKPVLALGLLLRLAVATLMLPRRGIKNNVLLQSSWFRLCDLLVRQKRAV